MIFILYYHEGLAPLVVRVCSITIEEPSPCHDIILVILFMHMLMLYGTKSSDLLSCLRII